MPRPPFVWLDIETFLDGDVYVGDLVEIMLMGMFSLGYGVMLERNMKLCQVSSGVDNPTNVPTTHTYSFPSIGRLLVAYRCSFHLLHFLRGERKLSLCFHVG